MSLSFLIGLFSLAHFEFLGQTTETFTPTGSPDTWTVPAGVTEITVMAWGGGGRDGSTSNNNSRAAGGAFSEQTISVTPGQDVLITVGAGSTTTAAGGTSEASYSSTVFVRALGGNSVPLNGITGATGGSEASGIGTVKFSGGNGANGVSGAGVGGGGSSAGTSANGNNASTSTGGTAPTGGCAGGNGATGNNQPGGAGSTPGGGGGGANQQGEGTQSGGADAYGQVTITYTAATTITVGGAFTANNKVYDGNTSATIAANSLPLVGVAGGDEVTIASLTIEFDDKNVETGKTVGITAITLGGADASTYTVDLNDALTPTTTANITAVTLTVTGLMGDNKVYDGTTDATASGTAALAGVIGSEVVTLGGTPVFTFATAGVGTGITINTTGYTLGGTDAGNYTLTQPTLSADITARPLNFTGSRVFAPGNVTITAAQLTVGNLVGVEKVTLGGSATVSSDAVGNYTSFVSNSLTLASPADDNYTVLGGTVNVNITEDPSVLLSLNGLSHQHRPKFVLMHLRMVLL